MLMVGDLVRLSNKFMKLFIKLQVSRNVLYNAHKSVNSYRKGIFRIVKLEKPTKHFIFKGKYGKYGKYVLIYNQVAVLDNDNLPMDESRKFSINTNWLRFYARPKKIETIVCDRPVRELNFATKQELP